jgi:hypothetical protein
MPPDGPFNIWTTAFQPIFADPVLLVGMVLPFLFVGILLYSRVRLTRRLSQLSARNAQALDDNVARWQESAARTEKMIALLTEIRDHLADGASPAAKAPKAE